MKLLLHFVLVLFISHPLLSAGDSPAFEINSRLGRGINIGNTFEAPSETAWSNPWNPDYARIISELGFSHIRVPVRWEPRSLEEEPYTIDVQFLERIKGVIDTAFKYQLHVIINMHHHDNLLNNPDGQKERFLSQWEQIADYFSDYPDSLLFEVLNEPHGNITPEKWNVFFAEALERIRVTNPDRIVLVGTAPWGGVSGVGNLVLPDDPNLILSVHYYSPFQFTHQGASWAGSESDSWLGTKWYDTETERETIENDFRIALQFSQEHNIPVHVGEFGAYSRADMESRVRWTTFNSRLYEQLGFSWAYWEFSAGFGIYNPSTRQLRQGLVDALLHNEMGEPTAIVRDTLYRSNFTTNNDGWSLNTGGGASATLTRESGELRVNILNGGNDAWNVQLVKSNILLQKGRNYRIAFTASANENKSITSYAGKATNPWNAYSSYHGTTITNSVEEYSHGFKMNNDTDAGARLVFDLGKNTTDFTLHSFVLEEITIVIPYSLNITAQNGTVIIDPETDVYMGGETYSLTAVPNEGYVFAGWSGDAAGTANPIELFINDDKNITALFKALYTLTVNSENGSVTVNPQEEEYLEGQTVTLTAAPDDGFIFTGWSGDASGNANPLVITIYSAKNITAVFSAIPVIYTLVITAENGSVTVDPQEEEYEEGTTVTLTAVADDGYMFTGWSGDASGDENPLEITMDGDKNITAIFDIDTSTGKILEAEPGILMYPNPFSSGSLTIKTAAPSNIAIYNVAGRLMMVYEMANEIELGRDLFETGTYIIRISAKNEVNTGILIVE